MNKEQIIAKLKVLGITSENCYPKKTFIHEGQVVVGLYERETKEPFYFWNAYDGKIYEFSNTSGGYDKDVKTDKFLIPLEDCSMMWEDIPYQEIPDAPFNTMTLRQYACIHLRIANSGIPWLDTLIKNTSPL